MTRTASGWMVQGDSPNVLELTFALSRPTTTTTRPTSRWRRCRTSSLKGRAHARAPQRRRLPPSPRPRRRPSLRRWPQKRPQCPRARRRLSPLLRRRRRAPRPPLRTQPRKRRPLPEPQQRHPLPQPQNKPQPHAATRRETVGPRNASWSIVQSPTEMATWNWQTTLLTAWWGCSASSSPCAPHTPLCI